MKRYNTSQQIVREIDKAKEQFSKLIDQALVQENMGRESEAKSLRVKARQIKDNRLDMLKAKLAEFQTDLLPGVITDGDRSIPASSKKPKRKMLL